MTESDKLLAKADALLARGRTSVAVPRPPTDYPVLTEVVKAPTRQTTTPQQGTPPNVQVPLSELRAGAALKETAVPDSRPPSRTIAAQAPEAVDVSLAQIDPAGEFPNLSWTEPAQPPSDTSMRALEERVYLRVLSTVEPYVGTFIEEPLQLRLEELARRLATGIAQDARDEILMLVRDAVRSAVARELETRRDE